MARKTGVSVGMKVNLGDYQSADFSLWDEALVEEGNGYKEREELFDRLKVQLFEHVTAAKQSAANRKRHRK